MAPTQLDFLKKELFSVCRWQMNTQNFFWAQLSPLLFFYLEMEESQFSETLHYLFVFLGTLQH